ncbi:Valine--tRNA ligase, chloroplastic/mitochondrial 2 [Glycine soja]|uniref:valine--tRNA ligase n=1 Tax=Glycine soja TaxID=3848 RepID=A0A445G8L5_GLYSO|nr:Valine--tRNA ligase, chloroplastic/mitochondrial 2 [Glycine soja]
MIQNCFHSYAFTYSNSRQRKDAETAAKQQQKCAYFTNVCEEKECNLRRAEKRSSALFLCAPAEYDFHYSSVKNNLSSYNMLECGFEPNSTPKASSKDEGCPPLMHSILGRKMSKTLGNVIDPLDTIKEFGTDALRFTLALGTAGQDLNLSTERLTSNKAFTNKLWNAGKFILQNLPNENDTSAWEEILSYKFDSEVTVVNLPLPECWVVSKLHLLIDSASASYDKFYFGEVGRETYDFFWADFADWYIEASKERLYQSGAGGKSVASVAQAVLLYTFENILKVLHPFMPFVTEELWQALPYRKHALIVSPWPETQLPRNTCSVKKFENFQALVRAIRNARAEYSVEPAKRISASVVANNEVIEYIAEEREVLALLSRLDLQNLHFTNSFPGNADQSVHLVAGEGLEAYLPLADMVDISAEVDRLSKRLSKMQKEYDGLIAKLNSPQV